MMRKRKYPMTLGMVENNAAAARSDRSIAKIMCATGIQLALFCLLRVSEYVPNNVKDIKHE